eukprot:Protomagalhaensia_wolfi_Nauph_80__3826@NODE_3876_length_688_cov_98_513097_g2417_i1_p1_GENE_NODE_3876_length_688_cov_98_513097_g2417_i1NODE_3876_length_688_cov_98_513097_g2417_i1_p1_ORF_typecomplete_len185_score31_92DDE_Tnp_1_2/PF13586_6/0_07_NODE_3876_length_688_cov_98_513097_g2417_i166620
MNLSSAVRGGQDMTLVDALRDLGVSAEEPTIQVPPREEDIDRASHLIERLKQNSLVERIFNRFNHSHYGLVLHHLANALTTAALRVWSFNFDAATTPVRKMYRPKDSHTLVYYVRNGQSAIVSCPGVGTAIKIKQQYDLEDFFKDKSFRFPGICKEFQNLADQPIVKKAQWNKFFVDEDEWHTD